jgi:hypothetical protein
MGNLLAMILTEIMLSILGQSREWLRLEAAPAFGIKKEFHNPFH